MDGFLLSDVWSVPTNSVVYLLYLLCRHLDFFEMVRVEDEKELAKKYDQGILNHVTKRTLNVLRTWTCYLKSLFLSLTKISGQTNGNFEMGCVQFVLPD